MTGLCKKGKSESVKHQISNESLKDQVFRWLSEHRYEKPWGKIVKLAVALGLNYAKKRDYLYQLSRQFKALTQNGGHPYGPNSQHNWRAVGNVGFCLKRKQFPVIEKTAIELGWTLSRNRNKELSWVDTHLGRIRWWATGKVVIFVKKPCNLGRAKQLASKAFIWNKLILDEVAGVKFLDDIHWYGSDDVYDTPNGQRLPYMRIDAYKDVFGEIILGDSSHPKGVEIKVCPKLVHRNYSQLTASTQAIQESLAVKKEFIEVLKQVAEQNKQLGELLQSSSIPLFAKDRKDKVMVV